MGLKHSPVRNSIVAAPRIMKDETIDQTPQRTFLPNISERQRSISSPPMKGSPVKGSPVKRDDSLQTVQYENIRTNLEKNNQ